MVEPYCYACGAPNPRALYTVDAVPVHSVLLMPSRDEALQYPRGRIELGFCPACGFIQNNAFDPSVHEYSTRYEETQGFSPTFTRFAEELARGLVERYGIRGKTVLEIGCGKGEFLSLLVELGDNRGIGIDPSLVPERLPASARNRILAVQDFYENHVNLTREADVVVCRHTLEHIQPVQDFIRLVREGIGNRRDVLVCFEVPDVARVLEENAFWDVYYEHCSYFSLGSLGRLFREAGFELLELYRDYGDQYLILVGRVGTNGERFSGEESPKRLERMVALFEPRVQAALAAWRERLAAWRAAGRRVVLWGGGSKGVAFLTTLGLGEEVGYVVDINPYKQGMYMPGSGHEVVAPAFLEAYRPDVVIVMNPIYTEEIRAELARLGLEPELVRVGVPA